MSISSYNLVTCSVPKPSCTEPQLKLVRLRLLQHGYFHNVDLAFVRVHMSAQLDMMPHMTLQRIWINYIPGFSVFVRDKRDFFTVGFHRALDIHQLGLLLILVGVLWISMCYNRNPKGCHRECQCQNG